MGAKSKYETHVAPHLEDVKRWFKFYTEGKIANKLGVSHKTFIKYKAEHEELRNCLEKSKDDLVVTLKEKLVEKAFGCKTKTTKRITREKEGKEETYTEEYEQEHPPDVAAIHLLLKNLDDTWRNDDKATMDIKRGQLELAREKEENKW